MTRPDLRRARLAAVGLVAVMVVGACAGSVGEETAPSAPVSPSTVRPPQSSTSVAEQTSPDADQPPPTVTSLATATKDDIVTRSTDAVGEGSRPEGLGTAVVRITSADGSVCEVCMWLADSSSERIDGLRRVDDLGGLVGMAFAWDRPDDGNFVMIDTPTPLSIAWFDRDGAYLGEVDMDPCVEADSDDCRRYNTTGRYSLAIEMFRDGSGASQLSAIGVGPGSTAEIIEVLDSSSCEQAR